MKVADIMTRKVISIPPDTPALAVARLLVDRAISAVPVVDPDRHLLGVLSEADLIRRLAVEDPPEPGWWNRLFYDREAAATRYTEVHGATAGALMTRDVVTVTEATTAEHAAQLLDSHHIRRLPVVEAGVLVGIVSRADLLRALLVPVDATSDAAIRASIAEHIARLPWAASPFVFFDVAGGEVSVHGFCESIAVRDGLLALARDTPGVTAVTDTITITALHRWA